MTRLAALVGLASEATLLRRAAARHAASVEIAVSGADPAQAHWEAGHLARRRPDLLVSFGLAGGLDPALRPGTVVVADSVILPDGARLPTAAAWSRCLRQAVRGGRGGAVLGADAAAAGAADKRALAAAFRALSVDMESHAVARAAHDSGVPFVALRAVCDPAHRSVPEELLDLIDAGGRLHWRAALLATARQPRAAATLWWDSRRAHAALAAAAAALCRLAGMPPVERRGD